MIKIIKNKGQCKAKALKRCKYLLYTNDFNKEGMYAKISLKPIVAYVRAKLTGSRFI